MRDQIEEAFPKQRRFSARDPQLLRCRIDEVDESEVVRETIGVVDALRRLRAHQAVAVALLGHENEVVLRRAAVERADEAVRIDGHYVAVVEIPELAQSVRERSDALQPTVHRREDRRRGPEREHPEIVMRIARQRTIFREEPCIRALARIRERGAGNTADERPIDSGDVPDLVQPHATSSERSGCSRALCSVIHVQNTRRAVSSRS